MFYSKEDLNKIGFISVGNETRISKKAVFHGIKNGKIGDCVRIDDFVSIKGSVDIGNFVHIASFCLISGTGGEVVFKDFSGTASHCSFHTAIEDFINPTLTSPSIDSNYSTIISGGITLGEGSKLGSGCIVMPGTSIGMASTASAGTVISRSVDDGAVIGPKYRHFKIYGYRDINTIKKIKNDFNENI